MQPLREGQCACRDQATLTWNPTGDTGLSATRTRAGARFWSRLAWQQLAVKIWRNQENSTSLEFWSLTRTRWDLEDKKVHVTYSAYATKLRLLGRWSVGIGSNPCGIHTPWNSHRGTAQRPSETTTRGELGREDCTTLSVGSGSTAAERVRSEFRLPLWRGPWLCEAHDCGAV